MTVFHWVLISGHTVAVKYYVNENLNLRGVMLSHLYKLVPVVRFEQYFYIMFVWKRNSFVWGF